MNKDFYWVVLFSQTGSEIVNLSKRLGFSPNLYLTNKKTGDGVHPDLINSESLFFLDHKVLCNHIQYLAIGSHKVLITLHGYLRIIPPEICMPYKNIYNGHPGAIHRYPDLKGKDPQMRSWNQIGRYPYIGSVVHEVTAGVDEGNIVSSSETVNLPCRLDEHISTLRETSLQAWLKFFERNV